MEFERKALYNLLRMNREPDSVSETDSWKVEDYRKWALNDLIEHLADFGIVTDRIHFTAFAENCDSPEELTEILIGDTGLDREVEDRTYLLIFEIWRRLIPEKQSLSTICDELDHRIDLYDRGETNNDEPIQDALAYLQVILDEQTDQEKIRMKSLSSFLPVVPTTWKIFSTTTFRT